jgi:serine/threonine protein kinase
MGATGAVHPTDDTLQSFGLGKLDDGLLLSVREHLEGCDSCRRRAAELSSDDSLGRPRKPQVTPGQSAGSWPLSGGTFARTPKPAGPTPPPDNLPPELADHPDYEIVRELGRGGMGVVYLAHNRLMGRDEVLKVVSGRLIERATVRDRFLREIQSAARLQHKNVVTAYAARRLGESIMLAMEYVEGVDLAKLVKSVGPLPIANACNYIHQAALGLQHAHERGMVHRDIKPANLILARDGQKAIVKLLDFGLAKVTSEGEADSGLTREGQMLGTPDYIAPEQIRDAQSADIRADIYSLGCTFYYLLAGGPPFRGANLWDIYQAHFSMDAGPLNLVRPEVPAELAAVVAKMMAKEPGRRFQTPGEVARALTPFFKAGASPLPAAGVEMARGDTQVALHPPSSAGPAPVPGATLIESNEDVSSFDASKPNSPEPQPAPSEAPARRPPWVWPALIAASVAGVLGLAVVVPMMTGTGGSKPVLGSPKPIVTKEPPRTAKIETNFVSADPPKIASVPASVVKKKARSADFSPEKKKSARTAEKVKRKSARAGDLVAFFSFDDGTASDSSGHGYNGIFSFKPPNPEPRGYEGGAMRFHAREDNSIRIPVNINPSVMPQITMGGWAKPNAAGVAETLISHDNAGFDRTLGIDGRAKLRWSCFTGNGVFPGAAVSPRKWTFVCLRHDQSSGHLILDVDGERFSKDGVYFNPGRDRTTIGRNPSFGAPFDGLIDNVFIYKSVLGDARIEDIRARGQAAILRVAD